MHFFVIVPGFPPQPFLGHPGIYSGLYPSSLTGKRKRRHRTIFTEHQLTILEETFSHSKYPDIRLREELAERCHLKEERVEVSFSCPKPN